MRLLVRYSRVIALISTLILGILGVPQRHTTAQGTPGGMLAVVGTDGNVSVFDANGANPFPLTTDAQKGIRLYNWPTWSTDGRLAFTGISVAKTDPYSLRVFVVDQVKAGAKPQTAYSSATDVYTYDYWSPGDCLSGDCRDLALLYTPATRDGLALRMIRDDNGKFTAQNVGKGSPFYYSFSPDGQQMFWFRDTTTLEIYDVGVNKVTQTFDDTPGQFQSPMWSPTDDRILIGVAGSKSDKTDVVIAQGSDRNVIGTGLDAPVSFGWSPDAQRVASIAAGKTLTVTDVQSAKVLATETADYIVADFWSPQSDRVAYMTLEQNSPKPQARLRGNVPFSQQQQATAQLVWNVLDVKSGTSTKLIGFTPTSDMVYYLQFFDQFSRSHSLWSPDGRYVTYGAVDTDGTENVMILDTQSANASPVKVSSGTIGIWSWK